MPKVNDLDWDGQKGERADVLLDSKRTLVALDSERIGHDDDWRLRVAMLREEREERESERARKAAATRLAKPGELALRSELMRRAWQAGKFEKRRQGYAKRTEKLVKRARELRADGQTYEQIGNALEVTAYTAAKWLGWERKPEPTNRRPAIVDGVRYASIREAERQTGISRWVIARQLAPLVKCK
jgi:hypothetical protein